MFRELVQKVKDIFSNISMPWEDSPEEKKAEAIERRGEIEKEIAAHKK